MKLETRLKRSILTAGLVIGFLTLAILIPSFLLILEKQKVDFLDALSDSLENELIRKTEIIADTLAQELFAPVYYYDFDKIRDLTERTDQDENTLSIYVVDETGQILYQFMRPSSAFAWETVLNRPALAPSFVQSSNSMVFKATIGSSSGDIAFLFLEISLADLERAEATLLEKLRSAQISTQYQALLALTGAIALLAIIFVAFNRQLQFAVVLPITTLKESAFRVGSGDLETSTPPLGDDEIKDLGEALELMRQKLKIARDKAQHLAYVDGVTDLPNRAAFRRDLNQAINENQPIALLFLDLDDFKLVNDQLGHDVGDGLLLAFGQRAQTRLQAQHEVTQGLYRLGGDEFVLLINKELGRGDIQAIGDTLINAVSNRFRVREHQCQIGISLGVALFPEDGHDATTLLRHADIAMYQSKRAGKNRLTFYEPSMAL